MRKVKLFIALSVDGYIADKNGKVDWLQGQDEDVETEDTYSAFIKEIDTVLMGGQTYRQVVNELSPNSWPYERMMTYVFTHQAAQEKNEIKFTDQDPSKLVAKLKLENGKDIWVCGGANLICQLMEAKLIDEYHLSIIPTLLGEGIRLFPHLDNEQQLTLVKTRSSNGIIEAVYKNRRAKH